MKEKFQVTGMTCSACSAHVQKAVEKLEGAQAVQVNLLTESMMVEYDPDKLCAEQICKAVKAAGYGATLSGGQGAHADGTGNVNGMPDLNEIPNDGPTAVFIKKKTGTREARMKRRLLLSVIFLIPLMYAAMGLRFEGAAYLQIVLLLPILYLNRDYFLIGFKRLFQGAPNMDSLIAVGAGASIVYSLYAMSMDAHHLYFESAGMILTMITIGKYLETMSKAKTSDAIRKLMELSPKTAILLTEDGREVEIPSHQLAAGQLFLLKPGSLIPADGTVVEGASSIDESAVTGESVPVEKQIGDKVVSATLNKTGFLKCRADRVGEDTTLAQIIRLVEEASASKAPIARLADRVSGVFVPVVMGIALITFVGWLLSGATMEFAISSAISVLVISCPCALGLATPVAIMVGTGVGAKHGILIKSGEALQRAHEVDTFVLDKTGTITEGKLSVAEVQVLTEGVTETELLRIAAALEKKSEHPLAEAVITYASELGIEIPEAIAFQAIPGKGIQGRMPDGMCGDVPKGDETGHAFYVGNKVFLTEKGIPMDEEKIALIDQISRTGHTPLLVAGKTLLLGIIGVADSIRETSMEAIQKCREMGIHVVMLTGDNRITAEAVREKLQIDEVVAEVLPQDKEAKIRQLQSEGRKVAMVGDGINDAPALVSADVGMAIGAGTDVAMESADIVLMKSDLRDAVTAALLSRQVMRNIKQNLFWAFFYNAIGIPLAAGLLYPSLGLQLTPMFGAAAMSLSSVFVVTNALRLRGFQSGFVKKRPKCRVQTCDMGGIIVEHTEAVTRDEYVEDSGKISESVGKGMTKIIQIEGMMCTHCTGRVQKVLEAIAGVDTVTMSLEEKTATVTVQAVVTDDTLKAAIVDAGYEVTEIRNL